MVSSFGGHWGLPPDTAALAAAVIGCSLLALRLALFRRIPAPSGRAHRYSIAALAVLAAALSLGYWHIYLRGGPRIIDSTYYWLQAKTFATGDISLPMLWPSAALRGRFLHYAFDTGRLSVLFPPGYAAALAIGMAVKLPFLVGPMVALLLVLSTAALAKRAFGDQRAALIAGGLSAICAALRYHTADTLSHGWASLLFVVATWAALGKRNRDDALCGLCSGWLWATRPVTAIALFVVLLLLRRRSSTRSWFVWGLTALPGVLGWLVYQRVTTGSWFQTTQYAYYALADGPAGCFRYGFGAGIGCQYEHGDYVAKRLPDSYGLVSALKVSGVRLRWHLLDAFNFEPLMLLPLVAVRAVPEKSIARVLLCAPALLLLSYAPFYFDGNFPGGGARLLAAAIPLEHALVAGWLACGRRWIGFFALSLIGFACHGVFEHRQLQAREGGRPMFEPEVLRRAGITRGLILVNTDHGFALGHQPGAHDAKRGWVVARAHQDAHDRALWKSLGEPDVYYYRYDASRSGTGVTVTAASFDTAPSLRFEAEAEWPVLSVRDAWAVPAFPPCACVSNQRALVVHPSGPQPAVGIALHVTEAGRYRIRMAWVTIDRNPVRFRLVLGSHDWHAKTGAEQCLCEADPGPALTLTAGEHLLLIESQGGSAAIDWVELEPAD